MANATKPNTVLSEQVNSGQAASSPGPSHSLQPLAFQTTLSQPPIIAAIQLWSLYGERLRSGWAKLTRRNAMLPPTSVRGPQTHVTAYWTASPYIPRAKSCNKLQDDHIFASLWSLGSKIPFLSQLLNYADLLDGFQSPLVSLRTPNYWCQQGPEWQIMHPSSF